MPSLCRSQIVIVKPFTRNCKQARLKSRGWRHKNLSANPAPDETSHIKPVITCELNLPAVRTAEQQGKHHVAQDNQDHRQTYRPKMSQSGLKPTHPVTVVNEYGEQTEQHIPGEFPLTIRIDDTEIVTLMTLGSQPEALTLGYVRNQKLIENIEDILSIHVDWDRELVIVETRAGNGIEDWQEKLNRKIVTSGCGQGTIFSCTIDKLYEVVLPEANIKQSELYEMIREVGKLNDIYRSAGAVHGCALCHGTQSLIHVET